MNHEIKVTGRVLPISESTRKRNPQLYGGVGAVEGTQRKQDPKPALECHFQAEQKSSLGVEVRIVGIRKRLLDSDNFEAGNKHLRDCIAASLGIDDGDSRIQWCYDQIKGDNEGTIVTILSHDQRRICN